MTTVQHIIGSFLLILLLPGIIGTEDINAESAQTNETCLKASVRKANECKRKCERNIFRYLGFFAYQENECEEKCLINLMKAVVKYKNIKVNGTCI